MPHPSLSTYLPSQPARHPQEPAETKKREKTPIKTQTPKPVFLLATQISLYVCIHIYIHIKTQFASQHDPNKKKKSKVKAVQRAKEQKKGQRRGESSLQIEPIDCPFPKQIGPLHGFTSLLISTSPPTQFELKKKGNSNQAEPTLPPPPKCQRKSPHIPTPSSRPLPKQVKHP